MQKMLDDYAAGGVFNSVYELPSVQQWKDLFAGRKTGGIDIHHSVEKYIQRLLGIPENLLGSCPGIPLPRNKAILDQLNAPFDVDRKLTAIHKGMKDGGISGILQSRIPPPPRNTMTRQQIIDTLHQIHTIHLCRSLTSSGFQSWQYRCIEFMLGNKNAAMLKPHAHRSDLLAKVEAAWRAPSLYDESLRLLARRGIAVPASHLERDWTQPYPASDAVEQAWLTV